MQTKSNKSFQKNLLFPLLVLIIVLGGGVFFANRISHVAGSLESSTFPHNFEIVLNSRAITAEVMRTPEELQRGLSGRETIGVNEGMWFDFGFENQWGIWMKDMKFPIDIVWFDKNLEIIFIARDIAPETYPKVFTPERTASYVLELHAGAVEKFGLRVGDRAEIK